MANAGSNLILYLFRQRRRLPGRTAPPWLDRVVFIARDQVEVIVEDILACRVTRDLVKPHSRWLKRRPDRFRNPAGDDDDGREAIVAHLPEIAAMRSRDDECVPGRSRRCVQEGNDGIVAVEDACGQVAGGYLAKDAAWITHHGGA
jgi:hypothetical protein